MKYYLLALVLTFSTLSFSQTVQDPLLDITEAIGNRLSTNDWFFISVRTKKVLIRSEDRRVYIDYENNSLRIEFEGSKINLTASEKTKIMILCDEFVNRISKLREEDRFRKQIMMRELLIMENEG